jgi:hypothetical protein
MSTTTVAVKVETLNLLKQLKKELSAATFDETINKLALNLKRPKKTMFGSIKGVKARFVREEIDRFG